LERGFGLDDTTGTLRRRFARALSSDGHERVAVIRDPSELGRVSRDVIFEAAHEVREVILGVGGITDADKKYEESAHGQCRKKCCMGTIKQRLIPQILFCHKVHNTSRAAAMLLNARLHNERKHAPQSGGNARTVVQQILQRLNSILVTFKIIRVQCAHNLQSHQARRHTPARHAGQGCRVRGTSGMSVGSMAENTSGVSISSSRTSRMQLTQVCMQRA
jgi:hypothetical protein